MRFAAILEVEKGKSLARPVLCSAEPATVELVLAIGRRTGRVRTMVSNEWLPSDGQRGP